MDNSKYVFEMKENVPVRTSDASKGHEVVVYAEQILKEMGKNNSTGKYDKVVQGVRSLLGQSLLDGDKLKNAVRQEVERLLKKYNPNDMKTVDDSGIGFVPKPGKTKIKGFFVNSEGKQFNKVFEDSYKLMDFAREVKKNGGKFIGSASVNDSQSVFDKAIRSCDDEDPIAYAKKLMSECGEMNRRMAKLRTEASSKLNEFGRAILKYGMGSKEAEDYKTAIEWINNIRNLWS